jgi:hypothetical protein
MLLLLTFYRQTQALKFWGCADDGIFIEYRVHDRCPPVGGIYNMYLAITALNGIGIGKGIIATGYITTMGIGFITIC